MASLHHSENKQNYKFSFPRNKKNVMMLRKCVLYQNLHVLCRVKTGRSIMAHIRAHH
jgi:hypothetical protein